MFILTYMILLALALVAALLSWLYPGTKTARFWMSQPVVGVIRSQRFAWLRATLRSLTQTQVWVFEGYEQYSTQNTPFTIPSLDRGPQVIVPPRQIAKVYSLPETILDVDDTQDQTLQIKWTVWDKVVSKERLHVHVVRNQLNRNLTNITEAIADEIDFGFNRMWGTDPDWRGVKIWDTCLRIVAGAANGAFCGQPLCRDPVFLDSLRDHAMSVFSGALLISCTPWPLKSLSGGIAAAMCKYQLKRALKICLPFVKDRLQKTAQSKADSAYDWTPPNDGLQWIIEECYSSQNPAAQLDPKRVCHRIVPINDVSLHTSSFTLQNLILDLMSTDPSLGYVETLRKECAAALRKANGVWTRDAVSSLKLVDSAIRESMRISTVGTIMLPRKVVHPNGVMLENCQDPIPPGVDIGIPIQPIHLDEAIYPDAKSYHPFRFAQPDEVRRIQESFTPDIESAESQTTRHLSQEGKQTQAATLDNTFFGFGVGRHACPGRFFALIEMKLFVAYFLLNYELQHFKTRPQPAKILWLNYPSDATINVRRVPAFV
ncbi:ent-kaurene oxidase [Xylaria bambusicola]|uniref:ent-kaurene oxidase n=1 Tax=Xylaria bambusicola TaxID=326684 RepID=UPI00200850B6|nr:ent-kaurene oxidase [Xylaria bambusicola]KAI0502860.1 ent-kaurene oxidase [Xylaria bambusicola]